MSENRRAFLALGSNVGDRLGHLQFAVETLARRSGIDVVANSPVYESSAHTLDGAADVRPYLNAVVEVRTALGPEELLAAALEIERARGRDRTASERWAPRTLDIDLLLFGDDRITEADLTVPHPRLAERRFVLRPLADLAPGFRVPDPFDATVEELLIRCTDEGTLRSVQDAPGPSLDPSKGS